MVLTIPIVRNSSVIVTTTTGRCCTKVSGGYRRTQLIIVNTSAAAVVTLVKGNVLPAVAGIGIRLPPNGSYLESSDSGFTCWQGEVQVVGDATGTVAVIEQLEPTRM